MALVGIARLASQSELLEAKRAVQYFEIPARSILNRTKPNMPFQWTINPYRGCEFGCVYCYARYTHEFMELDVHDFEDKIYAKSAAAHLLKQELARVGRIEHIAIGTATDPYQPAERRYARTRSILEVFARERGRFLGITTKSDLVLRDIDLLKEIARANVLGVNITITTLDEKLARLLEPRAPRPALRLETVRRLSKAGICVAVFPNPIMPGLTDGERQLDRLARAAHDAGALSFGGGPLFLMPSAQKVFLPFLEKHFPALAPRYREMYATSAYLSQTPRGREYKETLQQRVRRIRDRYGLASGFIEYRPELWIEEQLDLWSSPPSTTTSPAN
ncbi:Radical SAM domain protein [Candidatus Sulfopaludibacter sp. SbA4]|nr:Radical SAM domain protein [Candidatus Sulfopaludibacter sp. SbA4]